MGKNKLVRFEELKEFDHVFQPPFEEVFRKDFSLKGKWKEQVFGNRHPLVLELGCGKGEYTLGLARKYPEKNFLGVDIKGARIWKGAKTAKEEALGNVAFLRTRIDFLRSFFGRDEVDEIWITFPDPQSKTRRRKKRLPGALFLNTYRSFLVDGAKVHLKTDNHELYLDTLDLLRWNALEILEYSEDVYGSGVSGDASEIQTYYEKRFLTEGKRINYLCFRLPAEIEIQEPAHEDK